MNVLPPFVGGPAVSLAHTHQLDLLLAGKLRRVFVAVPEGPGPERGHPVLWVLDGNTVFPLLAALLRQRAARPADMRSSLPVIVGLGLTGNEAYDQTSRLADYTPPGAERFLDMLTQLQPWLAQQLFVDPMQHTLFGHSFGGLFTLYTLFTRPSLFQRHLAASPSIWWGERAILSHRDNFLKRKPEAGERRRLLVTAGSLEEGVPHPNPERQRRQQERRQVSAARELVASLVGVPGQGSEFRLLDGEDHGSLVLPSALLALDLAGEGLV